jgi:hypothetical protein
MREVLAIRRQRPGGDDLATGPAPVAGPAAVR